MVVLINHWVKSLNNLIELKSLTIGYGFNQLLVMDLINYWARLYIN